MSKHLKLERNSSYKLENDDKTSWEIESKHYKEAFDSLQPDVVANFITFLSNNVWQVIKD